MTDEKGRPMTYWGGKPESETPLIKRLNVAADVRDMRGENAISALLREAATALSLAQTEIRGHMRVVDDLLKAEQLWRKTAEQAQARIAELEKDAARYRFLAEQHNDWHVERWIDTMRGSGTWQSIRGTALGNAIDAALKSRA